MVGSIEDFRDQLKELPADITADIEAIFPAASRVLSRQGLSDYVEGAVGLSGLGRGDRLVLAWIENMPGVAKECGEDILRDCISAAMKLNSMTSGEVIALLFESLPVASRRLGDPELVRAYLQLIHQLSAKAARGLRPMLTIIDELLTKLTLSGLRRWANFGADAYRRDLKNLTRYFSLESADSQKMLQQERRGTLFVDSQRKLNFYLRALWGRDFFLRPMAADFEGARSFIEDFVIYIPDAVDPYGEISGLELYRAMVAHQAAHISYTSSSVSAEQLSPAQMFFIGFVEDARIEWNAERDFPGLGKLWRQILACKRKSAAEHPTIGKLEKLALALSKPGVNNDDKDLDAFASNFHNKIAEHADSSQFSWELGLELFHIFAARKEVPSLRILNSVRIPYRDDNRFVWDFDELDWGKQSLAYSSASERQRRKYVSVMEMAHEVDAELAGDDAQEIWVCKDEFMPYEDAGEATTSFNAMWGREPISPPVHYHEWDYMVQLYRPDWSTIYERRATIGNAETIEQILLENKPITYRIRQIIDMFSPSGVERQHNLEDGDEIDLNAAIDALVSIRSGMAPDPRITMRNVVRSRDLAVTILLDLSESTNDLVAGTDKTVLDITKEAVALLSMAIDGIGDPFSIHGFASNGRNDVHYYRFKDFDQSFNNEVKARLDSMKGGLSTRMGTALRHAASGLLRQAESKKMILLITDGEPADIDERDPQYLRNDTKKAVEELASKGVMTYCLTLDPEADYYVQRIFGLNNYTILDNSKKLPDKLPTLFASLTH